MLHPRWAEAPPLLVPEFPKEFTLRNSRKRIIQKLRAEQLALAAISLQPHIASINLSLKNLGKPLSKNRRVLIFTLVTMTKFSPGLASARTEIKLSTLRKFLTTKFSTPESCLRTQSLCTSRTPKTS